MQERKPVSPSGRFAALVRSRRQQQQARVLAVEDPNGSSTASIPPPDCSVQNDPPRRPPSAADRDPRRPHCQPPAAQRPHYRALRSHGSDPTTGEACPADSGAAQHPNAAAAAPANEPRAHTTSTSVGQRDHPGCQLRAAITCSSRSVAQEIAAAAGGEAENCDTACSGGHNRPDHQATEDCTRGQEASLLDPHPASSSTRAGMWWVGEYMRVPGSKQTSL